MLLSDIAAVQHQHIEDVDCTDLPLRLPLQGTSMFPTGQALAPGLLWHVGLYLATAKLGKGGIWASLPADPKQRLAWTWEQTLRQVPS